MIYNKSHAVSCKLAYALNCYY